MQSLGFCCGRKYTYSPQTLCCYGQQLCTIGRDCKYFFYENKYVHILLEDLYFKIIFFPLETPLPVCSLTSTPSVRNVSKTSLVKQWAWATIQVNLKRKSNYHPQLN